jgi:hypothetical protein
LANLYFRNGQLCRLSDAVFDVQQTWARWSYGTFVKWPVQTTFNIFVKKPISWTFSKLFGAGSSDVSSSSGVPDSTSGLEDQQFVVMEVVKVTTAVMDTMLNKLTTSITDDGEKTICFIPIISYNSYFSVCTWPKLGVQFHIVKVIQVIIGSGKLGVQTIRTPWLMHCFHYIL